MSGRVVCLIVAPHRQDALDFARETGLGRSEFRYVSTPERAMGYSGGLVFDLGGFPEITQHLRVSRCRVVPVGSFYSGRDLVEAIEAARRSQVFQ